MGASKRIFELLDRGRDARFCGGLQIPLEHRKGHIRLQGVRFAYPSRPQQPVLKGLDLDFPQGEMHALVGPSGGGDNTHTQREREQGGVVGGAEGACVWCVCCFAGKSTIVKLINAFFYTTNGSLTMDGYEAS